MVSLSDVQSSNLAISSTFPPGLVALFVGATSGIGEATLKKFAQYSQQPRAYFVGRSQEAGDRIVAECKAINPGGEYIFLQGDVSLIHVVDTVCRDIRDKENSLNLLFLSAGVPSLDRSETSEHVHLLAALTYYSRMRFITNLLPLLQNAACLRRIVTVAGGGNEGPLDATDFPALRVPLPALRPHLCTLISLGLEAVARTVPEVGFIHDYPGTVDTPLARKMLHSFNVDTAGIDWLPIEECGERHLYLATSARFPAANGQDNAVPLTNQVNVARGTSGEIGSGVYSVGWDGESASAEVIELLAGLRNSGMVEQAWKHTQQEFERIVGLN